MMVRIITAFVLLAIASRAMAETKASCPSSITLNGMKMDLTLSSPIIVNKETNEVIGRSGVDLTFTAQDSDILWQKNLYSDGSGIFPLISQDEEGPYRTWLAPLITQSYLEPEILKKGSTYQIYGSLYDVNFSKLYEKNKDTITFKAIIRQLNYKLYIEPNSILNSYIGDKNIWQEETTLCLTVDWQYGQLPVKEQEEKSMILENFLKALMQ